MCGVGGFVSFLPGARAGLVGYRVRTGGGADLGKETFADEVLELWEHLVCIRQLTIMLFRRAHKPAPAGTVPSPCCLWLCGSKQQVANKSASSGRAGVRCRSGMSRSGAKSRSRSLSPTTICPTLKPCLHAHLVLVRSSGLTHTLERPAATAPKSGLICILLRRMRLL